MISAARSGPSECSSTSRAKSTPPWPGLECDDRSASSSRTLLRLVGRRRATARPSRARAPRSPPRGRWLRISAACSAPSATSSDGGLLRPSAAAVAGASRRRTGPRLQLGARPDSALRVLGHPGAELLRDLRGLLAGEVLGAARRSARAGAPALQAPTWSPPRARRASAARSISRSHIGSPSGLASRLRMARVTKKRKSRTREAERRRTWRSRGAGRDGPAFAAGSRRLGERRPADGERVAARRRRCRRRSRARLGCAATSARGTVLSTTTATSRRLTAPGGDACGARRSCRRRACVSSVSCVVVRARRRAGVRRGVVRDVAGGAGRPPPPAAPSPSSCSVSVGSSSGVPVFA